MGLETTLIIICIVHVEKLKNQRLKRFNYCHIENSEKYLMKLFGGMYEKEY